MNQQLPTENELEQKLRAAGSYSLSANERADMKARLLQEARRGAVSKTTHRQTVIASPFMHWFAQGSLAVASVVLVFTGTAYAAHNSLPGELLYPIKINVVEGAIGLTKLTTTDQLAYNLSLMETRLDELQYLAEQTEEPISADLLASVHEQIAETTADTMDILTNHTDPTTDESVERIEILSELATLARAQESVTTDAPHLIEIADDLNENTVALQTTLGDEIEQFVAESGTSTITTYLSTSIAAVAVDLQNTNHSAETIDDTGVILNEVQSALADGDLGEAIAAVIDAQQQIDVAEYLTDPSSPNTVLPDPTASTTAN